MTPGLQTRPRLHQRRCCRRCTAPTCSSPPPPGNARLAAGRCRQQLRRGRGSRFRRSGCRRRWQRRCILDGALRASWPDPTSPAPSPCVPVPSAGGGRVDAALGTAWPSARPVTAARRLTIVPPPRSSRAARSPSRLPTPAPSMASRQLACRRLHLLALGFGHVTTLEQSPCHSPTPTSPIPSPARAYASLAGNVGAMVQLRVNGVIVGSANSPFVQRTISSVPSSLQATASSALRNDIPSAAQIKPLRTCCAVAARARARLQAACVRCRQWRGLFGRLFTQHKHRYHVYNNGALRFRA